MNLANPNLINFLFAIDDAIGQLNWNLLYPNMISLLNQASEVLKHAN